MGSVIGDAWQRETAARYREQRWLGRRLSGGSHRGAWWWAAGIMLLFALTSVGL